MAEPTKIKTRIINKHATAAAWKDTNNFKPLQGELIIYDKDDSHLHERMKIGDGSNDVTNLPFIDEFKTDILTVNTFGGIPAGSDLNGKTTHEILTELLYPYVQPVVGNATASPSGGTYEKGVTKTITSVSISVTKKSQPITSVALYNGTTLIEEKTGDSVKNGGTITFSNINIEVPTQGNQLTVKVTDAKGTVQEKKTTAMTFVYPYYYGTCSAGATVDISSLTKKIESKGNKSCSFDLADSHIVFAYPALYGKLKSIIDPNGYETISGYGDDVNNEPMSIKVVGLDDEEVYYYVYVSKDSATASKFVVNFKY